MELAGQTVEKMEMQEWQPIANKSGIRTYKRDVAGSNFKEFRGEVELDNTLTAFAGLLMDAPKMASWMHKAEEVRVVEQISDNERIAYMAFDFTPLPKRDIVLRNKIVQDPETLVVSYSMDFQSSHPELDSSGRGHIQGFNGFVRAEPIGNGRSKVIYQAHVEPGAWLLKLPLAGMITNSLLADTPFLTLKNARKIISKYEGADIPFIQNAD